jgi:catechol 2,3-dioxygenase-like lactoylglutathione lyase family enzyme
MYLSHINVTMPKGGEATARSFYSGHLGLREMPKPKSAHVRDGLWFDAGGVALHLSVGHNGTAPDTQRHLGLGCGDVDGLKARLRTAGVEIEDGPPVPWKRFFIRDPFGNRIEIHAPGGLRV